jgi:hypothetical protein
MAKKQKSKRTKKVDESILSKEVQVEFAVFLQQFPPKEFARNLRSLVIEFMQSQLDGSADFTAQMLPAMDGLFDVLNKAEDNWKKKDVMELWEYLEE